MNKIFEVIFLECCKFTIYIPILLILSYLIIGDITEISVSLIILIYFIFTIFKLVIKKGDN